MSRLFRLLTGLWTKSITGEWSFQVIASTVAGSIDIKKTESLFGLEEMIRVRFDLGILTPLALTYHLPEWMLVPDATTTPPITLLTDKDVEIMNSVADYMREAVLYVTSGPELVAKYQFFCRTPFTVDNYNFLTEGVTEEEHRRAIIGELRIL